MSSFASRMRAPAGETPRPASTRRKAPVAPNAVERALGDRSKGEPLPLALRWPLEVGFGAPLGDVRIHADSRADELARDLEAEAFARGRDVYFRGGRYDAGSLPSPLLVHEIAHAVQQRNGSGPATLGENNDAHERDAAGAAAAVRRGSVARPATRARPPRIQRFESTEHERLGNVTGVADIDLGNGVHLSWGQVVALAGDYYATIDDLLEDTRTPAGRTRIRAALDNYGSPAVAATHLPPSTPAEQAEAGSRLVVLALRNVAHFVEGGDAHATWLDHHTRAISAAVSAGLAHDRAALDGAYLLEAFGQHFLTDSFAAGHIRTPRRDIIDWYVGTFAPRVFDHLVATLRARAVEGVYDQIPWGYKAAAIAALGVIGGPAAIRAAIRSNIQGRIDAGILAAGGRAKVIEMVGLGIAGAVSGAMHDVENVRGLQVSSLEHPDPWTSYGDANLDKIAPGASTPENRIQAERAVEAAKLDVDDAFDIAWDEGTLKSTTPVPTALPSAVFFRFDHIDLTPAAQREVHGAALYLIYNPDVELDLVGHTDRVGNDAYNDHLSWQRAQVVNDAIVREGVGAHRLTVGFRGEREPVTRDARQFWRNRRVVFTWRTGGTATASHDIALEHVQDAVKRRIGPPYRAERFLPTPVVGANVPLPDWHWGSMPRGMQADVATWVTTRLTGPVTAALLLPALDPQTVAVAGQTITIEPRPIARALATELLADPIRFLNDALGETAGP